MFKNKKFSLIAIGVLVMTLALGLVAFVPIESGNAETPGDEGFNHGRGPGGFRPAGPGPDGEAAFAEALGISVEELQAAHQTAQDTVIEQALDEGVITEAQAERLTDNNFKAFHILVGPDNPMDMDAHLADALGISADELAEAREAAKDAAIEQALADGKITEEQVEMMEARQALQSYMEKDEMIAKALGITVDDLGVAKEDGLRIPDLIEELGIEREEFEANLQTIREDTLQQAVEDDVITQEQADQMLENDLSSKRGPGGHGKFPGDKEGFERPDGFPGRPGQGGTNFQFPGQPTNEG